MEEKLALQEYNRLNEAIMSFLKQKVKNDLLKAGDENTAYFHAYLRKRRLNNQISRIKNIEGVWQEDGKDIEATFMQYYEQLLGSVEDSARGVSASVVNEGPLVSIE